MFDKIKRLLGIGATSDDPESFDPSRPQRANPNPPRRDWFARVSERSAAARASRAVAEAKALDALDAKEPVLSREAARAADELLARVEGAPHHATRAARLER